MIIYLKFKFEEDVLCIQESSCCSVINVDRFQMYGQHFNKNVDRMEIHNLENSLWEKCQQIPSWNSVTGFHKEFCKLCYFQRRSNVRECESYSLNNWIEEIFSRVML